MERGQFLKSSVLTGNGIIAGSNLIKGAPGLMPDAAQPLTVKSNRNVTLCIMIRTTPWEVSRYVKLHPRNEAKWHKLEGERAMREAFVRNNPDVRLSWGFTLNVLEDKRKNYCEIGDYVVECQHLYGDEVTYFTGYFPAMYLPRERLNREISEAIQLISDFVGNGYRPQSIIGGFLSADIINYLSEKEKIHTAHAVIWSQHNIDGGSADGSPSYPFYPSKEHFCKFYEMGIDIICNSLEMWVTDTKMRWPDTRYITFGEYGNLWRNQYNTNDDWNYRFIERGSGLGDSYNNQEISWYMTKKFRLAIFHGWHFHTPPQVIDFTRYDLPAAEPPDPSPKKPAKDWSLINRINQKGKRPQDRQIPLSELKISEKELIAGYCPEFKF